MFLLISHEIDEIQEKQAKELYGVRCFIRLPEELQEEWSNIPHEMDEVRDYISDIKEFIRFRQY
ncbi:hypothetical protein [Caldanaerovirga acetigignens]|nr:hypothetical protein [Caldanaerovirga acetigignens]